ncbi:MAG: SpoIIE family protein phosphatase [Flavobacteriales bacterium]|nr:SpoIIE family protein phosphatase [Flavobacteriales bacterium]
MSKRIVTSLILIITSVLGFAGLESQEDSLLRILRSENLPEKRVFEIKLENIKLWNQKDPKKSLRLSDELLEQDNINNYPKILSELYFIRSAIYRKRMELNIARESGVISHEYALKALDTPRIQAALLSLGGVHYVKNEYDSALFYLLQCLKINEIRADTLGLLNLRHNLFLIYSKTENKLEAERICKESLRMASGFNHIYAGACFFDYSTVLSSKGQADSAIYYAKRALEYYHPEKHFHRYYGILTSMCSYYHENGDANKAVELLDSCLGASVSSNHVRLNVYIKFLKGSLLIESGKVKLGLDLLLHCFKNRPGDIHHDDMINLYSNIIKGYKRLHQSEMALKWSEKYIEFKDSMNTVFQNQQTQELLEKYESSTKDKEILILKQQNELQQAKLKNANILKYINVAVLLALIGFVIVFVIIRKQKGLLQNQNTQIMNQSQAIERQNKRLTESLGYAKWIQQALVYSEEEFHKNFKEAFSYYQPKDFVSGDFFWTFSDHKHQMIAVVDCTGHGVSGAFLTILTNNLLDRVVKEFGLVEPEMILNTLSREFRRSIKDLEAHVGMEMGICVLEKDTGLVKFSGAGHSLFIINAGAVKELKGDYFSMGEANYLKGQTYNCHVHQSSSTEVFVMSTDGFQDQKGEASKKKLGKSKLKDILITTVSEDVNQRQYQLSKAFNTWKGSLEQIDDILIVGFKV